MQSHGLFLTGYSNGTLLVSALRGGKPLFEINALKGSLTGAQLNLEMAFGVVVSSKGEMAFVDLNGGVLERFLAHNEPIESVELCPQGRYVSTQAAKGQFRFWELCWVLNEEEGQSEVEWLPTGTLAKLGRFFKLS
jgi:hypothetical protein